MLEYKYGQMLQYKYVGIYVGTAWLMLQYKYGQMFEYMLAYEYGLLLVKFWHIGMVFLVKC